MMSLLALAVMIVLVATMRPKGGAQANRPVSGAPKVKGDRVILGPGVKLVPRAGDPKRPGVVSYALMKEKKLPSPAQRAVRRLLRPFGRASTWVYRRFVPPKHDDPQTGPRRGTRPSAELQNFLDARNREIARRKAEGDKPGPEDRLH